MPFAADSLHTYRSIEDDKDERKQWQSYFKTGGDDVYANTDITLREAGTRELADLTWQVIPIENSEILAWFRCTTESGGTTICNRGTIEIDSDAYNSETVLSRKNMVCHELAHSIGFHHGNSESSCVNDGMNNMLDR